MTTNPYYRTLEDNLRKHANMVHEISSLEREEIYYFSNYPPQFKNDMSNLRRRKQTLKNLKRVSVVVMKQTKERLGISFGDIKK